MIKACVIGAPISHSRSPLIHNHWLKLHGINGSYERVHVEAADLPHFFHGLRNGAYVGCNVTLPHKQAALQLVDEVDARATRIGAVNTVWMSEGRLEATSTDGYGFHANLLQTEPGFESKGASVVILGAGGSARAITDEMLRRGASSVSIVNRTVARSAEMATDFGNPVTSHPWDALAKLFPSTDLLVNTTSAGIADSSQLNVPLELLNPTAVVADINYVPLVTPLLMAAQARNLKTVSGLGMLLHQAVEGFELWFGTRPTVTPELHDMIAADIKRAHAT